MHVRPRRSLSAVVALALLTTLLVGGAATQSRAQSTDCSTIQNRINTLPPGGGQVIVGPGTWLCRAPIVIDRDSVDLRGHGQSTVLRLADGANAPVIVIGQTIAVPTVTRRRIQVADLRIDGNRRAQAFECHQGPCSATNALRNNGISLRRVEDVSVQRVSVTGARSGGLVSELVSRRLSVRDFTVIDSHFDGVAGYQTSDSVFSGLSLHNNLAAGLSFDIQFNGNLVTDSVITRSGSVGNFMRDSRDNQLSGLQIRDSVQHGVFLAQVDADATKPAAGNTFSDLTITRSGGAGIRVNDASNVNNMVVGAQLVRNTGGCTSEAVSGQLSTFALICR